MAGGVATIFAPASGHGRSAVAILRISGPAVRLVMDRVCGGSVQPRRATVRRLCDPGRGTQVDEGLVLFFPGPASVTGEDVLELHHHGGIGVARALVDALTSLPGLRPAEPGEFTKRAFLNGKLDLTQAEGLADLIDATTTAQAQAALRQLSGLTGRFYASWREQVLEALAMIEAEIDFAAEEEVPEALWLQLAPGLAELAALMRRHLDDGHKGERLRRGFVVAVVGAPNVGKSSLVNALARRDVAIVTPIPGTTRDVIEVSLDLAGLPVTLLDTAGLRETQDPIEMEGMARARQRAEAADLRLWVFDNPHDLEHKTCSVGPFLRVLNKSDLRPAVVCTGIEGAADPDSEAAIAVSAATGAGIDTLLAALERAARRQLPAEDAVLVTRGRHRAALMDAAAALERAVAVGAGPDLGLLAEELRLAGRAIGRVTGAFGVEDILDRVFGAFCIGK